MRIFSQWYSAVVTLLFIAQSMLLVVLMQSTNDVTRPPPVTQTSHFSLENCPTVSAVPCDSQVTSGNIEGGDVDSMAYLYNKFRVVATEVKRQVLMRKGERVDAVPTRVSAACSANLVAATYNLWNINPPWDTRLKEIVALIKDVQPHIIGVQEIRKFEGKNQLEILKEHLPEYKYSVYEKVQDEQRGDEEGLGILSKYPILEGSAIKFEDTKRKCLGSLIQTPQGNINFFVTHFSLNDIEQCTHALILWEYLNSLPNDLPQILVGDMNTYFDFEWPMDLLTQGLTSFMLGPLNPCSRVIREKMKQKDNNNKNKTLDFHIMKDAWEELYPAVSRNDRMPSSERWWGSWAAPPGHTFSNYGDQDPSRTDRLYFYSPKSKENKGKGDQEEEEGGSSLQLCDVSLFGDAPIKSENNKVLFPSDHKGVAGHFRMARN